MIQIQGIHISVQLYILTAEMNSTEHGSLHTSVYTNPSDSGLKVLGQNTSSLRKSRYITKPYQPNELALRNFPEILSFASLFDILLSAIFKMKWISFNPPFKSGPFLPPYALHGAILKLNLTSVVDVFPILYPTESGVSTSLTINLNTAVSREWSGFRWLRAWFNGGQLLAW
jgi:hypothetical protein